MKMDLGMLGFCRARKTFRPLNKRHSYFIAMHTAPNKDLTSLGSECPRSGHSGWFEHQERHSFTLNKIQENEEIERDPHSLAVAFHMGSFVSAQLGHTCRGG